MELRTYSNPPMRPLPIDVICDILARLPVKCLLRSKSVCKSWYALISSPHFINLHIRMYSSYSTGKCFIFATNDHSLYSVVNLESPAKKLSFFAGLNFTSIAGSCNGLLLCLCNDNSTLNSDVCLVNPSTLHCRKIPYLKVPKNYLCVNYGFGYDHISDDYKVVRIVNFVYGCEVGRVYNAREVMVYSLRANSWKFIEEKISNYATLASRNGALINNHLLHWMFWCTSKNEHQLSSFNVCYEQWGEVTLPHQVENGMINGERGHIKEKFVCNYENIILDVVDLGVLDGCLCLLTKKTRNNSSDVDVWIMKEYGVKDSWMKLFNVSDLDVTRSLRFAPMAYSNNGKEILLRRNKEMSLFWYDMKEKRTRNVEISGLPNYCGMTTCIQSLVPLDNYVKADNCDQQLACV